MSPEGFALVAEMLANGVIDVEVIIAHVHGGTQLDLWPNRDFYQNVWHDAGRRRHED